MIPSFVIGKRQTSKRKRLSASGKRFLDVGQYKGVANRACFAIFHAMRAVLALDKFDTKKHSGIIAKFRESYIKTNRFDAKISEIISTLFRMRSASDYNDFYLLSKEEAVEQMESAKMMVVEIESFISAKY